MSDSKCNCKNYCIHKLFKHGHSYRHMYSVFHTVVMLFAIYLSFRCNNGFQLVDFLFACCCPVLFILYKAAVSPDFCALLPPVSNK
jgi:hypothetical protein